MKTKQLFLTCVLLCSIIFSFEAMAITVKFQKPSTWSKVYLYAWLEDEASGASNVLGSWPGRLLVDTNSDGWHTYSFDTNITGINFIFSNGQGVQSSDLFTDSDVCVLWDSNNQTSSYNELLDINCDGVLEAFTVEIDGIYYQLIGGDSVEVTYRGDDYYSYDDEYTGSVTIPETVVYNSTTYRVTTIGNRAFYNCSSLTSVTIPNSVTAIGGSAFADCSSLTQTNYTGDLASWCKIQFDGWGANPIQYSHNLYINGQSITKADIPEGVMSISQYAFYGLTPLTEVTIPNSVTSIGKYAFSGCSSLTSINIPNSVTTIGNSAFYGCSSLTAITIPNSVTTIGDMAFEGCSSLTAITIPNSVTSIGYNAFYGCSSLTSVTIPNSVTTIGDCAFWYCFSLTEPVYNDHVFVLLPKFYSGAYTIPAGIKSIAGGAFSGCSSLTSVTIPNSVTTIGDRAFEGCSSLTSVTIPQSVTSIGDYAFYSDKIYKVICYAVEPPTITENTFSNAATIAYVPEESVKKYIDHPYWSRFVLILPIATNGIDDINIYDSSLPSNKVLENGILYILRNGEKYTIDGRKIE